MLYALMISAQHGHSYEDQLAAARAASQAGFQAFFRSDHYSSAPGPLGRPTTDAWSVLAGLARETISISLGTLMSPVTFRLPGNLAKIVTTVDEMSGGRVEVAVGAGWNEDEHRQFGFPFPPIGVRAAILEEQLAILHGLWTEPDGWNYSGHHYSIANAGFHPKAVPTVGRPVAATRVPRPWIIVGGEGSARSMRLAVRWADEFNLTPSGPEDAGRIFERLTVACVEAGRDPGTLRRSVLVPMLIGRSDRAFHTRMVAVRAILGISTEDETWARMVRSSWIAGIPDDALKAINRYIDAGAERLILQDYIPKDLEMIHLAGDLLVGSKI
jgi:alkanesulfonate monooxygenase SsuD/methylene tetrahydromethanopterin reductase-like flavin-dependent oxidoreductase (luciferase family)